MQEEDNGGVVLATFIAVIIALIAVFVILGTANAG